MFSCRQVVLERLGFTSRFPQSICDHQFGFGILGMLCKHLLQKGNGGTIVGRAEVHVGYSSTNLVFVGCRGKRVVVSKEGFLGIVTGYMYVTDNS